MGMESIIKDICIYILNNINNEITINELEKTFCYNKFYIIRIFKEYTGFTIKEFVNNVKVLKTVDPLIFTDDTILKIALSNGFNSQEYYSEKFKELIGISPLKFRKEFNCLEKIENIDELKSKKNYLIYLKQYEQQLLNFSNTLNSSEDIKKLMKIA